MARPEKQTADYYPHYVDESPTMSIMENTFGNDGYACLHKLLEQLCRSEGHVYDARNKRRWMFLVSKMRVSEDKTRLMLDLLAEMDFIDPELWDIMLIWCGNLVENLGKLYEKRKGGQPLRPSLSDFRPVNGAETGVSDAETTDEDSF